MAGPNKVGILDSNLNPLSSTNPLPIISKSSLIPVSYDFIDLNFTGDDLTEVIYKSGGSSGTTVATLTLAWSGGKLDTVTRS